MSLSKGRYVNFNRSTHVEMFGDTIFDNPWYASIQDTFTVELHTTLGIFQG